MATNEELEARIERLEKDLTHLSMIMAGFSEAVVKRIQNIERSCGLMEDDGK